MRLKRRLVLLATLRRRWSVPNRREPHAVSIIVKVGKRIVMRRSLHSNIVDPNLFVRLQVIVNDHPTGTHNGHVSDFSRLEPTTLDRSEAFTIGQPFKVTNSIGSPISKANNTYNNTFLHITAKIRWDFLLLLCYLLSRNNHTVIEVQGRRSSKTQQLNASLDYREKRFGRPNTGAQTFLNSAFLQIVKFRSEPVLISKFEHVSRQNFPAKVGFERMEIVSQIAAHYSVIEPMQPCWRDLGSKPLKGY